MENLLRMGMQRTSMASVILMGIAISTFSLALAPTPAAAFECVDVNGDDGGAIAVPTATACGTQARAIRTDSTGVGTAAAARGDQGTALGAASSAGGAFLSLYNNVAATAIGYNAKAGVTAEGQHFATALGARANANALNATALGADATANFTNSTAIGQGVATSRDFQVAIGNVDNTYTLTGVGSADSLAAQDPTSIRFVTSDSGGNLALSAFDPSSLATSASVSALDSRVTSLEGTVGENREEARGGTALALAAAGLRYDDRPEKLSIAGGVGHFKGLTGLSFGVGYATSDTFRINGAVSGVPELGDVGFSAGVSWTLN
jgi:hypothetical protein